MTKTIIKPADPAPTSEAENIEAELQSALETPKPESGFHVVANGESLGCYPSLIEATHFAEGHLAPQEIEYEIREVA